MSLFVACLVLVRVLCAAASMPREQLLDTIRGNAAASTLHMLMSCLCVHVCIPANEECGHIKAALHQPSSCDTSEMASAPLCLPVDSARHAEEKRIDDVKKSFRVLHRWTDKSCGGGFDVVVFPDCVLQLDPAELASSKVIVFPASKVIKFRVIYTAKVPGETPIEQGMSSPVSAVSTPSQEFLSELRICVRDCSHSDAAESAKLLAQENLFRQENPTDIVLRWKDRNDK